MRPAESVGSPGRQTPRLGILGTFLEASPIAWRSPMHPTVVAFLDHLRNERNASPHTIRSYEDDLALFEQFLVEVQGDDADPTEADARRLRRYSAWLNGRGYAPSTVARRLASLRSFYRFH